MESGRANVELKRSPDSLGYHSTVSLVAISSFFAAIEAKSGTSIASSPQMPLRLPLDKEIKECTY